MGGKRLIRSNRESLSGLQSRASNAFLQFQNDRICPGRSNAAAGIEPGHFAESGTSPGDRCRADAQLTCNVADAQTAGRWPMQRDRDGDKRESCVFRRGHVSGCCFLRRADRPRCFQSA